MFQNKTVLATVYFVTTAQRLVPADNLKNKKDAECYLCLVKKFNWPAAVLLNTLSP